MLSKRELEVFHLLLEGLTNREIADRLFVCEKSVKFHCTNIYKKFKVKGRIELIVLTLQNKTPTENLQ